MAGVYISYPFCNQKCTFCNFASDVAIGDQKARYLTALLDEIRAHEWDWKPDTLYLGGGTPSLMAGDELAAVLAAIPAEKIGEATIECAPGTIRDANAWCRVGINRVSLGVQSFVREELAQTGRRHTAETVASDIDTLRNAGIWNINVDLIAGLPGQTAASWEASLDWIERIRPPHVSVYIFEIDEDSRLGRESLLGGVRYGAALLPSDDLTAELYERAVARLKCLGIERYEISNFAQPGYESAHNLKYWRLEPYVGFGLDAHSFDGRMRWSNPDDLKAYLAGASRNEQTPSNIDEEHMFVGLRLAKGIETTEHERQAFREPIAKWVQAGMLEQSGSTLKLTDRGVLLSNEVLQDFVAI